MKSQIEAALKGETQDFFITEEERITLVEILGCVCAVLMTGVLHFNGKGDHNKTYANFCYEMARRFANMPIHKEH